MSKLMVVVGGQFGSEGKGAIAARLCAPAQFGAGAAVRVAGPNAGHSAVGLDGQRWALRQIPVAAVVNEAATLHIAAGSEIDQQVLTDEVNRLEAAGYQIRDRLFIDRSATLIDLRHQKQETNGDLTGRIGSTGKGIGAARADRIWRDADLATSMHGDWQYAEVDEQLQTQLRRRGQVLIEGTQGYGLGLHTRNYPFVTSSDCRAIDFMAMAGVSPWSPHLGQLEVWVCVRPYPIRVAGNSGPLARETTWADLRLPEERTTVTQKIRRVGRWDTDLVIEAIRANGGPGGPVRLALTMGDQIDPTVAGATEGPLPPRLREWVRNVEITTSARIWMVGTGPGTQIDLRRSAA